MGLSAQIFSDRYKVFTTSSVKINKPKYIYGFIYVKVVQYQREFSL